MLSSQEVLGRCAGSRSKLPSSGEGMNCGMAVGTVTFGFAHVCVHAYKRPSLSVKCTYEFALMTWECDASTCDVFHGFALKRVDYSQESG